MSIGSNLSYRDVQNEDDNYGRYRMTFFIQMTSTLLLPFPTHREDSLGIDSLLAALPPDYNSEG